MMVVLHCNNIVILIIRKIKSNVIRRFDVSYIIIKNGKRLMSQSCFLVVWFNKQLTIRSSSNNDNYSSIVLSFC